MCFDTSDELWHKEKVETIKKEKYELLKQLYSKKTFYSTMEEMNINPLKYEPVSYILWNLGAYFKDAKKLSKLLHAVGDGCGLKVNTILSDMNQVLGNSAGLYCEILESISTQGKLEEGIEKSLTEVITELKKNFNS